MQVFAILAVLTVFPLHLGVGTVLCLMFKIFEPCTAGVF